MIEGYTHEEWRKVCIQERVGWYVEAVDNEARTYLTDPYDKKIADELIDLTRDIYTGALQGPRKKDAEFRRAKIGQAMVDSLHQGVRRVVHFNDYATVIYFLPEVKPLTR